MSPLLHPDRLFPAEPTVRAIARELYGAIKDLPIVSPHGHTDPEWFSENENFSDPASLLITPDHYLLRMLYSQGIALEKLGVPPVEGGEYERDPRQVWRRFAENYFLFRATPTALWLNHVFAEVFALTEPLSAANADAYYDTIQRQLQTPEFKPRALFERFKIEVLCTTDSPVDDLAPHKKIRSSGWQGRVIPCFRPDPVLDPEHEFFADGLQRLGKLTGEDTQSYRGYLRALQNRREYFKKHGATSTDHGHPSAATGVWSAAEAEKNFAKVSDGRFSTADAEIFRGMMLVEMARMSLDDGLVMQLHPGSYRNHNPQLMQKFGRDKGADIPVKMEYVRALKPLLDLYGNDPRLTLILFTLDESTYTRELAPLAGHYPALKLGPAWWFHDSPEGMRRYREQLTETAGLYNTVGFNDDTRAFLSIPARHDVARRVDCAMLARWVAEHRMTLQEAHEVALDLSYNLVKKNYKL